MTAAQADADLRMIMKKIDVGAWVPPDREQEDASRRQRTVRHATDAYIRACTSRGLAPNTLKEYAWRISYIDYHLGHTRLSDLTWQDVEKFRDGRREAGLSPKSVNSFVQTLAAALDAEIDDGTLSRNVAKRRGRSLKLENKSRARPFMTFDHVGALLDAATKVESNTRPQYRTGRRAFIATIWLAGLRVTEACGLTWGDWDQTARTLRIGKSKTDAGVREVVVFTKLHAELIDWKDHAPLVKHDAPMFPNANGGHRNKDNVSRRVINERLRTTADDLLRDKNGDEQQPLPERVTAHDGRRTYASWMFEAGYNPVFVQSQLGHTDPTMTLRTYARASGREPDPRIKTAMKRRK
jgi:integrase